MCFELVELYLENSLFSVKARLCNDGINAQNQQGSRRRSGRETQSHPREYLHFISICMRLYLHINIRVR